MRPDTRLPDTRHRKALDDMILGTEMANRVAVDWVEDHDGKLIQCSVMVCSMQLARRVIQELLLPDDHAAQVNVRKLN